jgi:hypothetical protein
VLDLECHLCDPNTFEPRSKNSYPCEPLQLSDGTDDEGSIPGRGRISSSPSRPHSFLPNWYRGLYHWRQNSQTLKLTTHLHHVPHHSPMSSWRGTYLSAGTPVPSIHKYLRKDSIKCTVSWCHVQWTPSTS